MLQSLTPFSDLADMASFGAGKHVFRWSRQKGESNMDSFWTTLYKVSQKKSTIKSPLEVRVQLETCSTINGTPVKAILDQKKLTGLAGGVKEGQNIAQKWASLLYIFGLGAF